MAVISMQTCGWMAEKTFQQFPSLKSLGATSKAAYLLAPNGQVVILSFDRFISPLTCTLSKFSPELRAMTPGETFHLTPQALIHPSVQILRANAILWHEPRPTGELLPLHQRRQMFLAAATWLAQHKAPAGFSAILLPFLSGQAPDQDALEIYTHIIRIRDAMMRSTPLEAGGSIQYLLGLGLGLTPSGDDLLNGLLLLFNRWPALAPLSFTQLEGLNQYVLTECRQRTTALSASLLELAARGSGDERLLAAADGLATGQPDLNGWLPELLTYGSSSGVDALLGMALAIQSGEIGH